MPDLWVPAEDAVNYAVAAVRQGTIATSQPLPPDVLQQDFVPESSLDQVLQSPLCRGCCNIFNGCSVWAYFVRKKPHIVALVGSHLVGLWQHTDAQGTTEANWLRIPASRRRLSGLGWDQSIESTTSSFRIWRLNQYWIT